MAVLHVTRSVSQSAAINLSPVRAVLPSLGPDSLDRSYIGDEMVVVVFGQTDRQGPFRRDTQKPGVIGVVFRPGVVHFKTPQ